MHAPYVEFSAGGSSGPEARTNRYKREIPEISAGTTVNNANAGNTRNTKGKIKRTGTLRARVSARRRTSPRSCAESSPSVRVNGAPVCKEDVTVSDIRISSGEDSAPICKASENDAPSSHECTTLRNATADCEGTQFAASMHAWYGDAPERNATCNSSALMGISAFWIMRIRS